MSLDVSRVFPPLPRIPSAASPNRLPQPEQVEPWSKPGADTIHKMLAAYQAAWQALDDLEAGRPDGKLWREVEDQAVQDDSPQLLADLYGAEPARYAQAYVRCRRAVIDIDAARIAGQKSLDSAAVKIRHEMRGLLEEFATHSKVAWDRRHRAEGYVALEAAEELHDRLRTLAALAAWCEGTDREYAGQRPIPGMDPVAAGHYTAARYNRDGIRTLELPAGTVAPEDWEPGSGTAGGYGAANIADLKRAPSRR